MSEERDSDPFGLRPSAPTTTRLPSFWLPSPKADFPTFPTPSGIPPLPTPTAPPTAMPTPGQPPAPMPTPQFTADDGQPYSAGGDPVRGIFWRNADGSGPGPVGGGTPIPLVPPTQPGAPTPLHPSTPDGLPWQPASFFGHLVGIESSGRNIVSRSDSDSRGLKLAQGGNGAEISQGYAQINTPTWRQFAPQAGVDLRQYPRAMLAPPDIQQKVAYLIPFGRFGPITQRKMEAIYGPLNKNATIGELAAEHGDRGSYAAPKTYTPATGHTPPSQWGRFSPSMLQRDLPAPSQTNDILHGAGAALLMLGSAFTGGALTPMINFYAHYVNARTEANRHKWQDALKESTARATMEAMDYGGAFNQFTDDNGNVTNPQGLSDEIANIAYGYGDTTMLHALQQGGVGAAQRLANGRNNWNMDLMKLGATQDKMRLEETKFLVQTQLQQKRLQMSQETNALRRQQIGLEIKKLQQQQDQISAGERVFGEGGGGAGGGAAAAPDTGTEPSDDEPAAQPDDEPTADQPEPTAAPAKAPPEQEASEAPLESRLNVITSADDAAPQAAPSRELAVGGAGRPYGPPPTAAPVAAPMTPVRMPTAAPTAPTRATTAAPIGPGGVAVPEPSGVSPIEKQIGLGLLRGSSLPSGLPPRVAHNAYAYGQWMQSRLDDVSRNPLNYGIRPDMNQADRVRAVENAVRPIDPNLANNLPALLNGQVKPPQLGFGGTGRNYVNNVLGLLQLADPNYDQTLFEGRSTIRKDYTPHGAAGKTLLSATRMAGAALQVVKAVRALKPEQFQNVTKQRWDQWVAQNFRGDPEFSNLFTAWRSYVEESVRIARMGTGNEGDIQALTNAASPAGSPQQIIGALKVDTNTAVSTIDATRQYWHDQKMPGEAPGYQATAADDLRAVINNLDPDTATFVQRGNETLPTDVRAYSNRVGATVGGLVVGQVYKDNNGNRRVWYPVDEDRNNPDNWQIGQ